MKTFLIINIIFFSIITSSATLGHDNSHSTSGLTSISTIEISAGHSSKIEEVHKNGIELTSKQISMAGIKIQALTMQNLSSRLYAPGEIKANGYSSYYLSPRVESVVITRHVTLGERVNKGDPLVTLFSEDVAQAQANYRVAFADWQRMKNLTSDTVSDKQKLLAQTEFIATKSRLKAYGLKDSAIKVLSDNSYSLLGEYTLFAIRAGAVLSDDFHQGQRINAGNTMMVLTDESQLWVEAKLSPSEDIYLPAGTIAQITIAGHRYQGEVIQSAHTIDPITRTRIIRLLVNNTQHKLHPGMFVDVTFSTALTTRVVAVPQSALIRGADGDWQVFIEEHQGEFKAIEVELGQVLVQSNDKDNANIEVWQEVEGLTVGQRIVVAGVFFVASQGEKAGFNAHNH
jgi:RND family efflux transporter MFP subunit